MTISLVRVQIWLKLRTLGVSVEVPSTPLLSYEGKIVSAFIKDGVFFCYCAYVLLRISDLVRDIRVS